MISIEENSNSAPVERIPALAISDGCLPYSKVKVFMEKEQILHFVSADGLLESETNKELIEHELSDMNNLKK